MYTSKFEIIWAFVYQFSAKKHQNVKRFKFYLCTCWSAYKSCLAEQSLWLEAWIMSGKVFLSKLTEKGKFKFILLPPLQRIFIFIDHWECDVQYLSISADKRLRCDWAGDADSFGFFKLVKAQFNFLCWQFWSWENIILFRWQQENRLFEEFFLHHVESWWLILAIAQLNYCDEIGFVHVPRIMKIMLHILNFLETPSAWLTFGSLAKVFVI